jgi:diketogulonate reductase-like aldo/keto reductase
MSQNFEVFDFELAPDEFETMTALDENRRVGGNPAEVN